VNGTITLIVSLFTLLLVLECAGTYGLQSFKEPKEEAVISFGDMIIENINSEFSWDSWGFCPRAVIVGKSDNGTMIHSTISTDTQGYSCLPNVPAGQCVLKVVIPPAFERVPVKLTNDWNFPNSEFYCM